jgi:hypothetical protein
MYSYTPNSLDNIQYISIRDIEFSIPMINKLKEYIDVPNNLIYKDRFDSYILSRTDSIIDTIKSNKTLPPIDVTLHENIIDSSTVTLPKYIPPHLRNKENLNQTVQNTKHTKKITYSVNNGRNRVVASLVCGLTHIPAKII